MTARNYLTAEDIRRAVTISRYLDDNSIRHTNSRAVAQWRGGDGLTVSFNDERGTWKDHKTDEGGSVIDLCMTVERLDFRSALKTLGGRYNVTATGDGSTMSTHSAAPKVECLTADERRERRRLLLPDAAKNFTAMLIGYCKQSSPDHIAMPPETATNTFMRQAVTMSDAALDLDPAAYRGQAARQLRALGSRLVWAGTIERDEATRERLHLRAAKTRLKPLPRDYPFTPQALHGVFDALELADRIERGEIPTIPTHYSLNPLDGNGYEKPNAEGGGTHLSYDCLDAVKTFDSVLIEFDDLKTADGLPSQEHFDLIGGLVDYSVDHGDLFNVSTITYTGGKSLHAVLRLPPTADRDTYRRNCERLADLFAASDDPRLRCDLSGWNTGANGGTHTRLAGAVNPKTGRRARLLYAVDAQDRAY